MSMTDHYPTKKRKYCPNSKTPKRNLRSGRFYIYLLIHRSVMQPAYLHHVKVVFCQNTVILSDLTVRGFLHGLKLFNDMFNDISINISRKKGLYCC